jgi:hypothetical protein
LASLRAHTNLKHLFFQQTFLYTGLPVVSEIPQCLAFPSFCYLEQTVHLQTEISPLVITLFHKLTTVILFGPRESGKHAKHIPKEKTKIP